MEDRAVPDPDVQLEVSEGVVGVIAEGGIDHLEAGQKRCIGTVEHRNDVICDELHDRPAVPLDVRNTRVPHVADSSEKREDPISLHRS